MRPLGVAMATALVIGSSSALAAPGPPPPGYLFSNVSSGLPSSSVQNINQLIFKSGDSTHLYASRGYSRVVTRYDFNAITGQLTNPFTVLNLNGVPDGMPAITGIGFHGNDLWVTRYAGGVSPRPAAISRLRDGNGDGVYSDRNDFLTGIELGIHTINQVQIYGNSLYTGIGTQTNTGNPANEGVANGTIVRIGDLNSATPMSMSNAADRAAFVQSGISDGRARRYAGGMRNPFGIRVFDDGSVWVSDNGQDPLNGAQPSPDWLYRDLQAGDFGAFPVEGNPGAPVSPVTPLVDLGDRVAATGFDVIPSGPHRGDILVAFSSPALVGRRLARVDAVSGEIHDLDFIVGFNIATDVVSDPFGRLLVADHNGSAVYLLSPPPDGDANLDRVVNIADLQQLASNWQDYGDWSSGDFDRSGFVDESDLGILAINWNGGAADAPSLAAALAALGLPTVPEPAGAIALCAIVFACYRRSNRRPT